MYGNLWFSLSQYHGQDRRPRKQTKEAEEVVDSFGASITSKISEIATVAEPLASLSVLLLWRSVYSSPQPVQPLI